MSKYRYTVETLKAGQPRPYADTIAHVRVTMEVMQTWRGSTEWEPNPATNTEWVYPILKGLCCGFTDFVYDPKTMPSQDAYFRTRLDWCKMVEPGVWEFHTTSAFTD
jgi:hypothetical protein